VQQAHQNLRTSSVEIASALNLAIEHEQDLAISAGAFIIENPNASETDFIRWVRNVDAFQRYPEILSIAEVDVVRPSQLKAFAARATLNAKESNAPEQTFTSHPLVDVRSTVWLASTTPDGVYRRFRLALIFVIRHWDRSYSERPIPGRRPTPRQPGWSGRTGIGHAALSQRQPPVYRRGPPSQPHRIHRN